MPFGFPRKGDFPSFLCKWLRSLHLQDSLKISGFLHPNKSLGLRMSVTKLAYACPGSFNPDWKNLLSVQNKSALSLGGVAPAIRLLRKFNSETFGLLTVEDVEAALNEIGRASCRERV